MALKTKKSSQKIIKKVKNSKCNEHIIVENVLIENTTSNPISTNTTTKELLEAIEDNLVEMSKIIQRYGDE